MVTALGPRPIAPEQLEPLLAVINTVAEARAQALVATGRGRAWPGADDLLTDAGGPGLIH